MCRTLYPPFLAYTGSSHLSKLRSESSLAQRSFFVHFSPWLRKQEENLMLAEEVSNMTFLQDWVQNLQGRGELRAQIHPFCLRTG